MGTDIHTVVQVLRDGKWVTVAKDVATDRDYSLFAILAGVRNGYGFAGIPTGDAVKPISEPRGLPDDFLMDEEEDYLGDHSHSWLLLSEMNDYANHNALANVGKTGVISLEHYLELKEQGLTRYTQPKEWCGAISGRDIVTLSVDEVEEALTKCMPFLPGKVYVQYNWIVSLIKFSRLAEVIDEIYAEASEEDPKNIRFVFGFDS